MQGFTDRLNRDLSAKTPPVSSLPWLASLDILCGSITHKLYYIHFFMSKGF